MNDEKKLPSHRTANRAFKKATILLDVLGTSEAIRKDMQALGYTDGDHEQGWALMRKEAEVKCGACPYARDGDGTDDGAPDGDAPSADAPPLAADDDTPANSAPAC